jgi:hypothetical protein
VLEAVVLLLTHQTRIQFWALDFEDVDLNILLGNLFDFFLEAIHFLTTTANHNTWTAGVDGNGDALQGALDDNLGNTTTCDTCFEVFARIFSSSIKLIGIMRCRRTSWIPNLWKSQDGVRLDVFSVPFRSRLNLLWCPRIKVTWLLALADAVRTALGGRLETLQVRGLHST